MPNGIQKISSKISTLRRSAITLNIFKSAFIIVSLHRRWNSSLRHRRLEGSFICVLLNKSSNIMYQLNRSSYPLKFCYTVKDFKRKRCFHPNSDLNWSAIFRNNTPVREWRQHWTMVTMREKWNANLELEWECILGQKEYNWRNWTNAILRNLASQKNWDIVRSYHNHQRYLGYLNNWRRRRLKWNLRNRCLKWDLLNRCVKWDVSTMQVADHVARVWWKISPECGMIMRESLGLSNTI